MKTEEFRKAVLPNIPFREGDLVMKELRERDERIEELTRYYKTLERTIEAIHARAQDEYWRSMKVRA